jgi:uncharacterized protein (DUF2249 family)
MEVVAAVKEVVKAVADKARKGINGGVDARRFPLRLPSGFDLELSKNFFKETLRKGPDSLRISIFRREHRASIEQSRICRIAILRICWRRTTFVCQKE